MKNYAKLVSSTEIEYAPINYGNILNFNKDVDLMAQYDYFPIIEAKKPDYEESYQVIELSYKQKSKKIYEIWTVRDYRTKEEAEAEKKQREKEEKINELKDKLKEIDEKSIRALRDNDSEYIEKYKVEAEFYREEIRKLINNEV